MYRTQSCYNICTNTLSQWVANERHLFSNNKQLTPSGTGTSRVVPEGACIASNVLSLKLLHISSCVTYAAVNKWVKEL